MSENRTCRRIKLKQINLIRVGDAENQAADHNRQNTLDNIPRQHNQPRFRSEHPKGVCGAGVAAAVFPDIYSMKLSVNKSRLEQAKRISNDKTD